MSGGRLLLIEKHVTADSEDITHPSSTTSSPPDPPYLFFELLLWWLGQHRLGPALTGTERLFLSLHSVPLLPAWDLWHSKMSYPRTPDWTHAHAPITSERKWMARGQPWSAENGLLDMFHKAESLVAVATWLTISFFIISLALPCMLPP